MEDMTKRRAKNHHFKIVPKPNSPFWGIILLRKLLRKTLVYIKKKSGMGLEPEPKWKKNHVIHFLLYKNLGGVFSKNFFCLAKGKKGVNFSMKTNSKHQ